MSKLKSVQIQYKRLLQIPFHEVEIEWRTEYGAKLYSPRIDLAIGPFSKIDGTDLSGIYNDKMDEHRYILKKLFKQNIENRNIAHCNIEEKYNNIKCLNKNARCFIAIEIENQVSRKHLMGGVINASFLGRIGIVIGWSDEKYRALLKLLNYVDLINDIKDRSINLENVIILNREQFESQFRGLTR